MKISKNLFLSGLLVLAVFSSFISCKKSSTHPLIGNWIALADFGGDARNEAVAFSIGEVGYVGTGYNGDERLKDFFSYDAPTNNWAQIATPPVEFVARTGAVAFSAGGKGYVGTGRDLNNELRDFWVYDPGTNTWDSVSSCPVARYGAVAFSINNIGYVGTGYNGNTLLDFYSYTPSTDTWQAIPNYPSKVREAVAFVLNNKGYVCTGEKNSTFINEFYMYDPDLNSWKPKRKISNVSSESFDNNYSIVRQKAVAFTIGGKAYVTTGDNNGTLQTTWEYDPTTDLWVARTSFEGSSRASAVAFSTESGRGFVTTGLQSSSNYFDDLFEFKPTEDYNEAD